MFIELRLQRGPLQPQRLVFRGERGQLFVGRRMPTLQIGQLRSQSLRRRSSRLELGLNSVVVSFERDVGLDICEMWRSKLEQGMEDALAWTWRAEIRAH